MHIDEDCEPEDLGPYSILVCDGCADELGAESPHRLLH